MVPRSRLRWCEIANDDANKWHQINDKNSNKWCIHRTHPRTHTFFFLPCSWWCCLCSCSNIHGTWCCWWWWQWYRKICRTHSVSMCGPCEWMTTFNQLNSMVYSEFCDAFNSIYVRTNTEEISLMIFYSQISSIYIIWWFDPWKCRNNIPFYHDNKLFIFLFWIRMHLNFTIDFLTKLLLFIYLCAISKMLLMYVWRSWYDAASLDYRELVAPTMIWNQASFFSVSISMLTVFIVILSHIWRREKNVDWHFKWCSIFEYSQIDNVYHLNFTFIAISIKKYLNKSNSSCSSLERKEYMMQ